jgi:hypothetical protein
VPGDRDELLRVVDNLIENAVKYGDSGHYVDVRLARTVTNGGEPEVQLSVRDYGPGIAPEHLPRLTERFYRANVAQSRDKGGTGLGLAIVKHIVNRHRGRLSSRASPGRGTVHGRASGAPASASSLSAAGSTAPSAGRAALSSICHRAVIDPQPRGPYGSRSRGDSPIRGQGTACRAVKQGDTP